MPHSVILKPFERNYGDLPENFDPHSPPFKVTQGHRKRRGSIGYVRIPITVQRRDERRLLTKIANYSNPRVFGIPTAGVPLEFCNGGSAHCSTITSHALPDGDRVGRYVRSFRYWVAQLKRSQLTFLFVKFE